MKQLVGDMHMHTLASGHSYGTIREMAQAASEKKLEVIGITEHAPGIPGTTNPFYFVNFSAVPRRLYGVLVYHGSEINVTNEGTLSLEERFISYLDYAIVGIHMICYDDAGRNKNTDNLIACMAHPKVRIVSHPDDDHSPLDYVRLVKAAKDLHVALEVNNSSFHKPKHRYNMFENYKTMLALCKEHNVPVIIDSDAHDPSAVGDFELASQFVEEQGFPEDLVLNTDRERLIEFLMG